MPESGGLSSFLLEKHHRFLTLRLKWDHSLLPLGGSSTLLTPGNCLRTKDPEIREANCFMLGCHPGVIMWFSVWGPFQKLFAPSYLTHNSTSDSRRTFFLPASPALMPLCHLPQPNPECPEHCEIPQLRRQGCHRDPSQEGQKTPWRNHLPNSSMFVAGRGRVL